jgi:hypothetical protein
MKSPFVFWTIVIIFLMFANGVFDRPINYIEKNGLKSVVDNV